MTNDGDDAARRRPRWAMPGGMFLSGGHGAYPIVDGGRMVGIVTRGDVLTRRRRRGARRCSTTPAATWSRSRPTHRAGAALEIMLDERIEHVPVVAESRLVGICTRTDLLKVAAARSGSTTAARTASPPPAGAASRPSAEDSQIRRSGGSSASRESSEARGPGRAPHALISVGVSGQGSPVSGSAAPPLASDQPAPAASVPAGSRRRRPDPAQQRHLPPLPVTVHVLEADGPQPLQLHLHRGQQVGRVVVVQVHIELVQEPLV